MAATDIFADLTATNGQPGDGWTPVNLNTLPDKPPIQPDLAETGLIYPGKRHVFSGPPESAKTLAAYAVLIQNARCGQTGVLIDFEMGAYDARQRLTELGATPDEIARIPYLEPDTPATPQRITTVISLEPALVVVDAAAGAYQLENLDDNKRSDVERFARLYIAAFWRHGIATILIDHVVKNAEFRGRFQIGSERKLGASDVHIGFDTIQPVSRGTSGRYKLIIHKDRAGYHKRGHLADFHLESDPDTHRIDWKITDPQPTEDAEGHKRWTGYMEKVSINLEHRDDEPSRNMVVDSIGGRKKYVLDAISALIREGFVTEQLDGRSSRLTSTRPYREDNPACNPQNTSNGSSVPVWFHSGSRNQSAVGGSLVPPTYVGEPGTPPAPDHLEPREPQGWFREDGQLLDGYFDEIAPDETELD